MSSEDSLQDTQESFSQYVQRHMMANVSKETLYSPQVLALDDLFQATELKDFTDADFERVENLVQASFSDRKSDIEDHSDLFIPIDNAIMEYLEDTEVKNTEVERARFLRVQSIRKTILTHIKQTQTGEEDDWCCMSAGEIRRLYRDMTYKMSLLSEKKFGMTISRRSVKEQQF